MPENLRTLTLDTIPDAIRIMNESSSGMSTEYHMDFLSFLIFKGYWNISSVYSLVRYVDGTPAALIFTCIDETAREAFIVYWGAVPQFRTRQVARALFDACCDRLFADGYQTLYGLSVPDRPVKRYRFIQATPQFQLFDMQAESLALPAPDPKVQVQPIDIDALLQFRIPAGECIEWSQRPNFLRHAAAHLKFLGAYAGGLLKAYAIIRPDQSGSTILIDLRSSESSPSFGIALLCYTAAHWTPPFLATNVADQSYNHRILIEAGFTVMRRFAFLTRDLRTTCSSPDARPA
jgi:hypothetical protein